MGEAPEELVAKVMERLCVDRAVLEAYCRRWSIVELAVFGSAVRDDFRPNSDLDLLYRLSHGRGQSLREWFGMREELAELCGCEVDMAERTMIEGERNWIRRRAILDSAVTVYLAPCPSQGSSSGRPG